MTRVSAQIASPLRLGGFLIRGLGRAHPDLAPRPAASRRRVKDRPRIRGIHGSLIGVRDRPPIRVPVHRRLPRHHEVLRPRLTQHHVANTGDRVGLHLDQPESPRSGRHRFAGRSGGCPPDPLSSASSDESDKASGDFGRLRRALTPILSHLANRPNGAPGFVVGPGGRTRARGASGGSTRSSARWP